MKNKISQHLLYHKWTKQLFFLCIFLNLNCFAQETNFFLDGPPIYYWQKPNSVNFGDYLSLKLVERILGGQIRVCQSKDNVQKFLAIGSVLRLARTDDIIWGSGMNAKVTDINEYKFKRLDIRAIRGPKTRDFIINNFNIECPEIYGDPALLIPYFFPEFIKPQIPEYDYIIIPHYSEVGLFPKSQWANVVYPTDHWREIIRKILNSKFVISSSLHGIVVAEAYGIPARYLRISESEPLFKYQDYYLGTNRETFQYATSVEEALLMGGEPPFECDLQKLIDSFPYEYWPEVYPNNLKNWEFDKEAAQNFLSGASDHCLRQGASEDKNFDAKPTSSKTNSSSCLGISNMGVILE